MILSVSNDQTTLWDQIEYSGAPESFAWVLPIHAPVDVGVSSDALFAQLDALSSVTIVSPTISCPPSNCSSGFAATATSSSASTGGVTVVAQATVGPYETVQLASSDPQALEMWLINHQYTVPPDVQPIIDDYVAEGFDFLAIKLVPGKDITSMQPVRVTAPGAGLTLPLRMVAAGTGQTTPITLWIAGEGRYKPTNFPSFTIDESQLVWNWDTQSSNYKQLKQLGFDATAGHGWLVESAQSLPPSSAIGSSLLFMAENYPEQSGYDLDPTTALDLCTQDLNALYGTLDPNAFWLTRITAELPRESLVDDLLVGASMDQSPVSRILFASLTAGTPPECPPQQPCSGPSGTGATGGSGGAGGQGGSGFEDASCIMTAGGSGAPALPFVVSLAGVALLGGLRQARRRRDRL